MRYNSELDVKDALGLPDWRHLTKDHFLQLLSMTPDMDTELALKVMGQIPEIKALSVAALDDAAKAFDATLASNGVSMGMVHAVAMERLALLRLELGRDGLAPDTRLHLLAEAKGVHEAALRKDTENKQFVSEQLDKRLWVAVACVTAIALTAVGAARAGATRSVVGRLA